MSRFLTKHLGQDGIGAVGLVLFVMIAVLPIAASIAYAALYSVGGVGLLSEGWTLRHWMRLASDTEIWASFGWSLYVAGTTVVLGVGLALVLALSLHESLAEGPLSYVIYAPLAIPATVAAFLVFQLFSGGGLTARVAYHLGLIATPGQFPGLVQDAWGLGIIVAHVALAVPFFTLLFVQIYRGEQVRALLQVASTLGADGWEQLYRVAMPVLLRQAFANVVLLFIAVLGSFEIPLLLGRQAPQMVSVLTYRKYGLYDLAEKPEAFMIALLYTVLVAGLLTVAFGRHRLTTLQ